MRLTYWVLDTCCHCATDIALSVVQETDAGIVVHGARVLATLPLADEIVVYPARSHRLPGGALARTSFAFAIPCQTPGLKFLCRESFDLERSHFHHPLGSRFEEMDAIAFFDHVLVPWERVFLLGDVDLCNNMSLRTHQYVHSGHQVVTKNVVKCEFILGLATLRVQTLGAAQQSQVQQMLAEIIENLEVTKACLRAAEADAALDQRLRVAVAEEPFLCNYPVSINVTTRPYRELQDYAAAHPEERQAMLDTLAYFDTLHLVPYIQCPTLVNVGMKDATCPAHTILPVFERITAPKALHVYPELTHAPCTDFNAPAMHWLRRYLGA